MSQSSAAAVGRIRCGDTSTDPPFLKVSESFHGQLHIHRLGNIPCSCRNLTAVSFVAEISESFGRFNDSITGKYLYPRRFAFKNIQKNSSKFLLNNGKLGKFSKKFSRGETEVVPTKQFRNTLYNFIEGTRGSSCP